MYRGDFVEEEEKKVQGYGWEECSMMREIGWVGWGWLIKK